MNLINGSSLLEGLTKNTPSMILIFTLAQLFLHFYHLGTITNFEKLFQKKIRQIKDSIIVFMLSNILILSALITVFFNDPLKDPNLLARIILYLLDRPKVYLGFIIFFYFLAWLLNYFRFKHPELFKINNQKVIFTRFKIKFTHSHLYSLYFLVALFYILFSLTLIVFPIGTSVYYLAYMDPTEIEKLGYFTNIIFFTMVYFLVFYPIYKVFRYVSIPNIEGTIVLQDAEYAGIISHITKNNLLVLTTKNDEGKNTVLLIPMEQIILAKGLENYDK